MLLDVCISVFEFYIYVSFFRSLFYRKDIFNENKKYWYFALTINCAALITGAVIIRYVLISPPLSLMLYTLVNLFCLTCLYQAKTKDRVFYSCVLIILALCSEIFVGFYFVNFMNCVLPSLGSIDGNYVFGMVCSKMVQFLLSRFLSIVYRKDKSTIPLTYWIILTLVPAISIFELHVVVLCATDATPAVFSKELLVIPGILAINILVFVIYDIVANQYEKLIQKEREFTSLENTKKRYKALIQHGQEMAALIHDSEKHLKIIGSLLKNDDVKGCLVYIDELGVKYGQSRVYERILPDNQALSIVLDTKCREAKQLGVDVKYEVEVSHKILVNDSDLCMIFVNAFDNAIRACAEYEGDKKIFFRIHQTYNRLSIQLQNTSNPVDIEINGLCKTTKKDIKVHGYGLKNIHNTVKSLDGNMQLIYEDNQFTLKILLFL